MWWRHRSFNLLLACRHAFSLSRRVAPELCAFRCALLEQRAQGRPGAGWHPRSVVRSNAHANAQRKAGGPERPGLPCANGLTAYGALSREPNFPSGLPRLANRRRAEPRSGPNPSLARLDCSNDSQDHALWPYALSVARRTRLARHSRGSAQSSARPAHASATALTRVHRIPIRGS